MDNFLLLILTAMRLPEASTSKSVADIFLFRYFRLKYSRFNDATFSMHQRSRMELIISRISSVSVLLYVRIFLEGKTFFPGCPGSQGSVRGLRGGRWVVGTRLVSFLCDSWLKFLKFSNF